MLRDKLSFNVDPSFKHKLLHWANQFDRVCILDSNFSKQETVSKQPETRNYELIAAIDSVEEIIPPSNCFETLKTFMNKTNDWLFGSFSYDLKNEVEQLASKNPDGIGFPLMHFFRPKYILILTGTTLQVQCIGELSAKNEIEDIINEISNFQPRASNSQLPTIKNRINKEQYLNSVQQLQQHIQQGDIYEVNFCQEFYAESADINPLVIYQKLNQASEAPFSCFYKYHDKYLLCASPERFIKKTGDKIISQPIKGTRKRGKTAEEDEQLKKDLQADEKERSENVMIVDLVRNDLARTAKRGSVHVDELWGIYTFKQVHQLISTISSEIKEGVHPVDVIKNAFPMGSMTGAPKIRAMELIEKHESFKRGLFSGSVGYFDPQGNFDFNVVIRSIQYNAGTNYISFSAGGAITAKSNAEDEYAESQLKARAMFEVLAESR